MTLRLPVLLLASLATFPALRAVDDTPVFIVQNEIVPPPAAPGAFAPLLANAPDGAVYLAWLEPSPDRRIAFRCSRFDAARRTWSPALTIGEGRAIDVPRNQTLGFAIAPGGRLAALWHPATALATLSTSTDDGANWSPPASLNRPGHFADDATLQFLPDGQLLASWIEPDATACALLARTLATESPPMVIDPSVSPDCAPAIAALPDSSALIAYRRLSPDGAGYVFTVRFHDDLYELPASLNTDDWKLGPWPSGGPALVARGIHLAVSWFTAARDPRVNISSSDNAGAQWLVANRVDDIAPLGRPALALFDDGSQLVAWVESSPGGQIVLLRRISARGNLSVPVQIGRVIDGAAPSIARVKEGDSTPAQVLIACLQPVKSAPGSRQMDSSVLSTRLITLPDADLLAEADPCDCDPRDENMRGYPIKGRILAVDDAHGTMQLDHGSILGVMKAGTTTVQTSPGVLRSLHPGSVVLARIERTGSDWMLFAVRLLAPASTPASR